MSALSATAVNTFYNAGDLMLTFQKTGSTNTVYVDLGNAATLYRGAAAGADATSNFNFLDLNSTLTSAFGGTWATDPTIYAGLAGVFSESDFSQVVTNGDAARTVYVSASRNAVGTVGEANSSQWVIFGDTDLSNAASDVKTQNDVLGNSYTVGQTVSPTSVSQIDDKQPITSFTPSGGVTTWSQQTAFRAFEGGIQQQGSATAFGTFGAAGPVEFALDLYRIVAIEGLTDEVAGTGSTGQGTYEGTFTVGTNGKVSFVTGISAVPEPSGALALGLIGTFAGLGYRRRRSA